MNVAIITDIPFLYTETMYLDQLQKGLGKRGILADVFIIRGSKNVIEGKIPARRVFNSLKIIGKLKQYDLIHTQFSFPIGLLYALLKQVHKKPILIHTHGVDVFSVPEIAYGLRRNHIGKILAKEAWSHATHLIAVCKRAKNQINYAGINPEKITVLYNGVNTELFQRSLSTSINNSFIRDANDLIFLNVAGFTLVKNHTLLIKAFHEFTNKYRSGCNSKLVLIGDGPNKANLLSLAKKLGISHNIIFAGKIPHQGMPYVYNQSDVFILPSFSEAHPWSLLEAMSCSLPVIASQVGGIPETINDNRFLIDPSGKNCVADLSNLMLDFAENKNKRKTIGSLNRTKVVNMFSFDKHLRELISLYSKIGQGYGK